jgi:hypothetical protein
VSLNRSILSASGGRGQDAIDASNPRHDTLGLGAGNFGRVWHQRHVVCDGAVRVAVIARLPKSEDRKLFDHFADKCTTQVELIELATTTLKAFEKRGTPLRPPPLQEGGDLGRDEEPRPSQRVK